MNPASPNQPVKEALLNPTRQQVGKKDEYRSLKLEWYKILPWLHLCITNMKVFCFHCLLCYNKGLLQLTKCYETAFFVGGFQNWKKGVERFRTHERTDCHKEAVMGLQRLNMPTIAKEISNKAMKTRAQNREMLLK